MGQFRVVQGQAPDGFHQHIRQTGKQQAELVGPPMMGAGAVREQACLRLRDRFWDIPVPKIDSAFDNLYLCPSRPGHQALRNNFASSLLLRTRLPMTGRRVRRPTLFSLWRKARRENSARHKGCHEVFPTPPRHIRFVIDHCFQNGVEIHVFAVILLLWIQEST